MPPLPYVQPASQGTMQRYANPYFQQFQLPQNPQAYQDAIMQGRIQMQQAGNNFGQNMPVQISGLRTGTMENGNPELQGGIANVGSNGQQFRIPNALLQQMMFQDAVNQGRSSAVGDFFGVNRVAPAGMNYTNMDVSRQNMDRYIQNNPQFSQEGALDPYKRAQENMRASQVQLNSLQNPAQPLTEIRNAQGGMMGGTMDANQNAIIEARKKAREAEAAFQQQNVRGAVRAGSQAATGMLKSMEQNAPRVQPTYSNIPISEKVVY